MAIVQASGFREYRHVEIAQQPGEREGRESAIQSRCVGDADVQALAAPNKGVDIDQIP